MPPREEGVTVEHPGTGVAHDLPDPLPHGRFVAVHGAGRAFRLVALEGAFFETLGCVIAELPALRAEAFLRSVVPVTEDLDHRLDGPAFGFKGWVLIGHVLASRASQRRGWLSR